jgi:hypothetical protein
MKMKIFLSFFLGSIITLGIVYFMYFQYCKNNWKNQGFNDGSLSERSKLHKKVQNIFGVANIYEEGEESFLSSKDANIIIVYRNEVKTLRVRR